MKVSKIRVDSSLREMTNHGGYDLPIVLYN